MTKFFSYFGQMNKMSQQKKTGMDHFPVYNKMVNFRVAEPFLAMSKNLLKGPS